MALLLTPKSIVDLHSGFPQLRVRLLGMSIACSSGWLRTCTAVIHELCDGARRNLNPGRAWPLRPMQRVLNSDDADLFTPRPTRRTRDLNTLIDASLADERLLPLNPYACNESLCYATRTEAP